MSGKVRIKEENIIPRMLLDKNLWQVLFFYIIASTIAVVRALNYGKSPSVYFDEGGIMTWLSFIQLLICSGISFKIFQFRKNQLIFYKNNRNLSILWLIISIGFIFLSLDEILQIHEKADKFIHYIFNLSETGLTDRIDDLIVVIYVLIAIGLLYFYREELKKYQKAFPTLISGFTILFAMIIIDIMSNRADFFLLITDPSTAESLKDWVGVIEETLKLFAEALFIRAFYFCLQISRRSFPQ